MGIGAFAIALLMSGCLDKENLYNPDHGKNQLPPKDEVFDYATRGEIKLSVNYGVPGFQTIIQVFDEYPIGSNGKSLKEGLTPVFAAYTDKDGKYEGTIKVPTTMKEAYLYTDRWGLPLCVKLELTATGAVYDAQTAGRSRAVSRAVPTFSGSVPYDFGYPGNHNVPLLSICKWDINGKPTTGLTVTNKSGNESLADFTLRIQKHFEGTPNKTDFLSPASITNIVVKENDTELDIIFMGDQAEYNNTLGYYYYKEGSAPSDRTAMCKMKKYIIFPNTSSESYKLGAGATARLKFFGDDYNQVASDKFPAGYVVGWFFISNGFKSDYNSNGQIKNIAQLGDLNNLDDTPIFFSNDEANKRFVSLDDKKSGLLVLGFEDQVFPNANTEDYSDVLFYVNSSKNISNGERPSIPDGNVPELKPGTDHNEGVLCFEDRWPEAGDYDLNDVAVRYHRIITFNTKNECISTTEQFTFIQEVGAATYDNFFAYQVNNMGEVSSESSEIVKETETGSIVINASAKSAKGKTFTVTRTFSSTVDKEIIKTDFNPYIIIGGYVKDIRSEVHLPKYNGTKYLDTNKQSTANDIYFTDKETNKPFAIDVADKGFKLSPERVPIESTYPGFAEWIKNKNGGINSSDWYKK